MQISLDEKNIFIHFCIHVNYMTYELVHNVLLITAVMTLLQCQGPEWTTRPNCPRLAVPWGSPYLPIAQPPVSASWISAFQWPDAAAFSGLTG